MNAENADLSLFGSYDHAASLNLRLAVLRRQEMAFHEWKAPSSAFPRPSALVSVPFSSSLFNLASP
jgi:hypothetical protein